MHLDKTEAAAIYADGLELAEAVLASLPDEPHSHALLSALYLAAHRLAAAAGHLCALLDQLGRHHPALVATVAHHAERTASRYHPPPAKPPTHSDTPAARIAAAIEEAFGLTDDTLPVQLAAIAQDAGIPLHAVIAWIHERPTPELSAASLRAWSARNGFLRPPPQPPA